MGCLSILTGLISYIGLSVRFVKIGITSDLMTVKSPMSGALSILYAGCPDLIGEIGGVKVIADFKTSNAPYMNNFPDRGDRMGFGGFRKYQKCAQQMAAYRYALNERTGYLCDVALIIVSTPELTQGIFIDGDQLNLYESRFLKRAKQFHDTESTNDEPVENSREQTADEQGGQECS